MGVRDLRVSKDSSGLHSDVLNLEYDKCLLHATFGSKEFEL